MKIRLSLAIATLLACTADDSDCEALGRHFVELSLAEAEAQGVSAESIIGVSEDIARELVAECKSEPRRKREIDCMIAARSFEQLAACS